MSDIYIRYRPLFGDSFDGDKYAVTPTKLCRTSFHMLKDSTQEDHIDVIHVDEVGSGSNDEGCLGTGTATMNVPRPKSVRNGSPPQLSKRGKPRKFQRGSCRSLYIGQPVQSRKWW